MKLKALLQTLLLSINLIGIAYAEQIDTYEQNSLGNKYRDGKNVEQDYKQAVYWYKKSALQGNDKAQNNLGNRYRKGQGVEQDYKKAIFWYEKAASQGNGKAQNNLGNMHRKGQGVERDMNKAAYWIKEAKEQGNPSAIKNWSKHKLWKYKDKHESSNTQALSTIEGAIKDYKAKNYKSSFAKFSVFAEAGNPIAQWYLGTMYKYGKGVKKDLNKAFVWMSKSAEQGDSDAQYALALMYILGEGVNKNPNKAFVWMSKSAEQGDADAQYLLAGMYINGEGVEEDEDKALELIIKAAEQGHKEAKEFLESLKKEVEANKQYPSSTGTGFVVTKDGVIATAEHVIDGCNKIEVDNLEASIVIADKQNDIALIKVDKTYSDIASIKTRAPKLGVPVRVFGFPLAYQLSFVHITVSSGNVNSLAGFGDDTSRFRYDASSQPGNSGGPIVNNKGRVVGVVSEVMKNKKDSEINRQNVNIGVQSSLLVNLMDSKRIPVIDVEIPDDNIVEHYENATKNIKCFE